MITLVGFICYRTIFIILIIIIIYYLKILYWHVRNFELWLFISLLFQLDFMLNENRLLTSLIWRILMIKYLRVDLKSNFESFSFHLPVIAIIFLAKGSGTYSFLLATTWFIKSLVHYYLTVERTPQKNFRSGYYLLSISSSGKYIKTSGSLLTKCQTFFMANSGQLSLKLYRTISLVSKSSF